MAKIPKPTAWIELISDDLIKRAANSPALEELLHKAQKNYLYWDTFKYQTIPAGFTKEEAWAYLKLRRSSLSQRTPVKSTTGKLFEFAVVNTLYQKLNFIDTHAASFIKTTKLSDTQKNKFIIAGLTEEAIATSQIEGANTSRKVAKELLRSQRPARTKDEQMIVNSYEMMQKLTEWKNLDLSEDMLLEIQTIVTNKTFDDNHDQGRFRTDADEIVVKDPVTNEIVHTPPVEKDMHSELKKLIEFANKPEVEEDGDFIHPVVKAIILHFWIAYLHPFVDGNGRTARAVFHWYLLKHDYWLVQYLAISRAIVHSRKKYDNVFIYSENENDLTYFISYIADSFKTAINKFLEYFNEKMQEAENLKLVAYKFDDYNPRQIALLQYFLDNKNYTSTEVTIHQSKHGFHAQTAYNDLVYLVDKGLLVQVSKKRKHIFMPNIQAIKKLFK
ncbi:MAG: Fic family protein [bacterium]